MLIRNFIIFPRFRLKLTINRKRKKYRENTKIININGAIIIYDLKSGSTTLIIIKRLN